jgi:hypothetical protein
MRPLTVTTALLLALACSSKPAEHPDPNSGASQPCEEDNGLAEPAPPDPSPDAAPLTDEEIAKCPVTYRGQCLRSAEEACAFINCPEERCEFLYSFRQEVNCRDIEDHMLGREQGPAAE